jgi:TRAP-type mannitol/chloroaromatic compound transport system permease small subunit
MNNRFVVRYVLLVGWCLFLDDLRLLVGSSLTWLLLSLVFVTACEGVSRNEQRGRNNEQAAKACELSLRPFSATSSLSGPYLLRLKHALTATGKPHHSNPFVLQPEIRA